MIQLSWSATSSLNSLLLSLTRTRHRMQSEMAQKAVTDAENKCMSKKKSANFIFGAVARSDVFEARVVT